MLVDVDGKYDPVWPSKADLTLLWPARLGKLAVVLVIDIHQGPIRSEKLAALMLQAGNLLHGTPCRLIVATARLRMDEGPWFRPTRLLPHLDANLHYSMAIPALFGDLALNSDVESLTDLVSALEETVGAAVREGVLAEYDLALKEDAVREDCRKLLDLVESETSLKPMDLLNMIRYRQSGLIKVCDDLRAYARDAGLARAAELLSLPAKGVWLDEKQCEMRVAPPVPVADLNERRLVINQMMRHDPLMLGMHKVLELQGEERARSSRGLAISRSGDVIPIPPGEEPQFDVRQNNRTKFHHTVLAYVRRPRALRTQYLRNVDKVILSRSELPAADLSMPSKLFNRIYSVSSSYAYAPNLQVLINNTLYGDERLTSFLSRGEPKDRAPLDRSEDSRRFETLEACERAFERYVDACVPEPDVLEQLSSNRGSSSGKLSLLLNRTSLPSVRNVFSMTRGLVENHLQTYYDYEAQKARSIAITLSGRTPENLMTLVEVPSYAGVVLTYVNNEALHFKTTWCKDLVLTSAPPALLEFCDLGKVYDPNHIDHLGMPEAASSIEIEVESGQLGFPRARTLRVVCGKLHSRNHVDLGWAIERPYKTLVRAASLIEMRGELYSKSFPQFEWGRAQTYEGVEYARREIIVNLTGFGEQSQQNSISQTAQRYLHQSLGSLDNDAAATLRKLEGIRLRGVSRVASHGMMSVVYALGVVLRCALGPEALTSGNGEVAVLMPDLMRASSLAQLNVSCYATPNQMAVEKSNSTASEALDVQGVWDNNSKVHRLEAAMPALRHGISESTARELLRESESQDWKSASHLAKWVRANPSLVEENVRNISTLKRGTQLVSCVFFETLAHVLLRLEVGSLDSLEVLSGQSLSDFFTTKGSFRSKDYVPIPGRVTSVEPLRKAAAIARVLADMTGHHDADTQTRDLARTATQRPDRLVDLYQVNLAVETGLLKSIPIGKGTDKDAPGKNREITTLEAVFGLQCVSLERIHMSLSKAVPEDLILTRDKEQVLTTKLNRAQLSKRSEDSVRTYYINRDMSAHGPTHKSCSSAVTVCLLAPNRATLRFALEVVDQSLRKKWLYPDNLVSQALGSERQYDALTHSVIAKAPEEEDAMEHLGPTRTAQVLRGIREQYFHGSVNGPAGSTWAEVADGMPGQGIFSIQASVSHCSVARLAKRILGEVLGWDLDSVINSDDSTVIQTVPADKTEDVRRATRPVLSRFIMYGGLCENEGKFTPTIKRPEFVSNFSSGSEPIAQVFKFTNALTALDSSANLGEDLQRAASRGADIMKSGSSFYIGSVVSAACSALAIDAHRAWGLYGDALQEAHVEGKITLMDLLPEEMGLPRIDPAASVLSSLGSRLASFGSLIPDGDLDRSYCAYLVSSLFSVPESLEENLATDLRAGLIGPRHHTLLKADGTIDAILGRQLQIPNVNGVKGALRRPKGTLRLARQLGPDLVMLPLALSDYKGKIHIGDVLGGAMRGLRNPIQRGEENPSPIVQISDLSHSSGFRNLTVGARSALRVLVDQPRVSQAELNLALRQPGACDRVRARFLEILSQPPSVPPTLAPVYDSLVEQAMEVLALARDLRVAHLEPNFSAVGLSDWEYGPYKTRKVLKRTFDVRTGGSSSISRDEILRTFLLETLRPEDVRLLPLELVRLLDSEPPRGKEALIDAIELAEVMTERLVGNLPHGYRVTAYVSAFARDGEQLVEEWLRNNVLFGHRAVWPGGSVRSRALGLAGALKSTIASIDQLDQASRIFSSEQLARDLEGSQEILERPLGGCSPVINGVSDIRLGGVACSLSRSSGWSAIKTNPSLLASAQAQLSLPRADLDTALLHASRHGWVGGRGRAHRVFGPVAHWGSRRVVSSQAYLCQTREWTIQGSQWTHCLVWTGSGPDRLSEVRWIDAGNRDYLQSLRDSVVLGRSGLNVQLPPKVRASGFNDSGRALTVLDSHTHRVLGAEDKFIVAQYGLSHVLESVSSTRRIVIPFGRIRAPPLLRSLLPRPAPSLVAFRGSQLSVGQPLRVFTTGGQPHAYAREDWDRTVARLLRLALLPGQAQRLHEMQTIGASLVESLGERSGADLGSLNLPDPTSLRDREAQFAERDWDVRLEAASQLTKRGQMTRLELLDLSTDIVAGGPGACNPRVFFGAKMIVALDRAGLMDPDAARALMELPSRKGMRPSLPPHAPRPEPTGDWAEDNEAEMEWEERQADFEQRANLEEVHRQVETDPEKVRNRSRVFDLMGENLRKSAQSQLNATGSRLESQRAARLSSATGPTASANLSESSPEDSFLLDMWAEWHASKALKGPSASALGLEE
jgi:hypothetical protein